MMKAPTNAPCQFESMPAISRALRMTSSKRRADDRAEGRAGAAHQVGAADHRRGDDAQLVALSHAR